MYRLRVFHQNERVRGFTLNNIPIIGQYRGMRASFGCFVYGSPEDSQDPPELHTCRVLTLRTLEKKKTNHRKHDKQTLKAGDPCKGVTKKGVTVVGEFQNYLGDQAYVRGHEQEANKLSPKQAFKVVRTSLTRL